jgi:hypothetical protein
MGLWTTVAGVGFGVGKVAEPEASMYLVTKMITQDSRFSFIYRYWRTVAASAE